MEVVSTDPSGLTGKQGHWSFVTLACSIAHPGTVLDTFLDNLDFPVILPETANCEQEERFIIASQLQKFQLTVA